MRRTVRSHVPVYVLVLLLAVTTVTRTAGAELPAKPARTESAWRLVPAMLLGWAAVAGLSTGLVFVELSGSAKENALAERASILSHGGGCVLGQPNYAPAPCRQLHSERVASSRYRAAAEGTFIVGGAAAVAVVLYLLWPSLRAEVAEPAAARSFRLMPALSPRSGGILVTGAF